MNETEELESMRVQMFLMFSDFSVINISNTRIGNGVRNREDILEGFWGT
jgi:hypothetical protein